MLKPYVKQFDTWNTSKKKLDRVRGDVFFGEREIWYCSIGVNIGVEQDGMRELSERPVIIYKKFNATSFLAIPLTRKEKIHKYHFQLTLETGTSSAILSQIRLLDAKRLQRKVRTISELEYTELRKALFAIL
jgi:mRNA interferase MazF